MDPNLISFSGGVKGCIDNVTVNLNQTTVIRNHCGVEEIRFDNARKDGWARVGFKTEKECNDAYKWLINIFTTKYG